jgi:plastocyanin
VLSGRTINWSVISSTVATISPTTGATTTVTGAGNGQTQVTATSEGISSSATITVTNSFPGSASITVGANNANAFDPNQVDIASGGQVTFTWSSGTHNVTWISPPAQESDVPSQSSGSATFTLTTPGTYNYHCTLHAGMDGSITVH